jgi:hypothetical protein
VSLRSRALAIVTSVVPSNWGDQKFSRVVNGSYAPGFGTTCGFLPSYMLWMLGCRDNRIVNRRDPAAGLEYHVGENVSRLVAGAKALGAWRDGAAGIKPADIFYINAPGGPATTEHVGVLMQASPGAWLTGDAGQRNGAGQQAARFVHRPFDGVHLGTMNGPKVVVGHIDIEALHYAAAPPDEEWMLWALVLLGGAAVWALESA